MCATDKNLLPSWIVILLGVIFLTCAGLLMLDRDKQPSNVVVNGNDTESSSWLYPECRNSTPKNFLEGKSRQTKMIEALIHFRCL